MNTSTAFTHYPDTPKSLECSAAYTILCNAHDTATSFLHTFTSVRKQRGAKGTPTDEEQDLLRACLVFAGAGLDSMAKQLVRDALPAVIDRHPGAESMLKKHVSRHILRDLGPTAIETLAEALVNKNPRSQLVARLIDDLTSGSLQSVEELAKTGSYFDIPSSNLLHHSPDLQAVFAARNQIVHEMDIDFGQPNRNRRPRSKSFATKSTDTVFRVAAALLTEVDARAVDDAG